MSQIPVVVQHAPRFTPSEAEAIAAARYGLRGRAEPLPSERDQNFKISCADGTAFVLKIANTTEREEVLDFQNAALAHLWKRAAAAAGEGHDGPALLLPRVLPDIEGGLIGRVGPARGSTDAHGALSTAEARGACQDAQGPARQAGQDVVAPHMVRLLTWVPGRVLAETRPHSRALLEDLGRSLGEMDRAFEGFEHPAMNRPLQWDLGRTPWIGEEFDRVERRARGLLERVLARFESHALPILSGLRRQVVHNDWNDYNILVCDRVSRTSITDLSYVSVTGRRQTRSQIGVVDFGDMLECWTVADLAVACAYAMLGKPDPIAAAAAIVRGFHERLPLLENEVEVLHDLIRARLAISVTMAACQSAEAPGNEYLLVSEQQAWDLLAALDAGGPGWAACAFRHACGWPATRTSRPVREWLGAHTADFAPVVDADLRKERVAVLDLGVGSLDIPNVSVVEHLPSFCNLVNGRMASAGAAAAIGRYDEARLVYVTPLFEHASNWEPENRTVHIGIDIFLPAGAEVHAPLDGVVHSFRNNAGAGDYGPTIILEHNLAEHRPELTTPRAKSSGGEAERNGLSAAGLRFFTLYGHLSEDSLRALEVGRHVRKGEVIARLGDAEVNGGWPPHLHFQVITDLLGRSGDFPGVAAPSERGIWLDLCPDPNLVLGIPPDRFPARPLEAADILALRRRHLGPSLSVSYRRPLTIVRGHMQFLFDADGRRYLDAVNNVPHVGHSHPRVVAAAARQLAVLNTNTRYLNPVLAAYVERLAALMPAPLSVCYIVCSGSEANELALRLARSYTGRRGVVVVDGAYHGNTTSLVDISPYKFDGPGGGGQPAHVRKVPMPDTYRGLHRPPALPGVGWAPRPSGGETSAQPGVDEPASAGPLYAEHVAAAVRDLDTAGVGTAAFFCESLLSCGGQVVLPPGYLQHAYAAVRADGGVCVADEVQVGFGRVGSHWWGFETQGVVPDIVTLGKPIGNGFPLAAVVTRPEIARAFDNGMEYFNTFGGSQAACAAGHAVLDVMRDEGLQERAAAVGGRLKAGLEELKARFPLVGDVRGLGLFLGVELVASRETLEPAAAQADYVVNRLRERGILVSTDGPLHNVVKIKPPLQFSAADADRLVDALADVLAEDAAQP